MKKCPKCGAETFYATAHVTQDWKMDRNGNYIETEDDCIEVTHYPEDEDIWTCANCYYEDSGIAFEIKEKE